MTAVLCTTIDVNIYLGKHILLGKHVFDVNIIYKKTCLH